MKVREIACEYQPYILRPPVRSRDLYARAASNDEATIESFGKQWIDQARENKKHFGSFKNQALGQLLGKYLHRPVICAGSGPSLKYNAHELKDRKGIPLVSCLHNFQYFTDLGVDVDYWVSLDAGLITVEEVSEGGKETPEHYWEKTEGQTLIAYIGSHPELLKKWRGKVYFFNAPVPDSNVRKELNEVEVFNNWVSSGGNVLGASVYIAKAYFGAGAIIYVGADFSFGYDRKFHSWDSKYDRSMGNCIPAIDIFGNRVPTWPSYSHFKSFFDYVATEVPGIYINCTEGGTLGAYNDGNIMNIKQMDLKDCIKMYSMSELIKEAALNPEIEGDEGNKILY